MISGSRNCPRKAERTGSPEAGDPTCFSEVPPDWQHSTQSPVEWEQKSTGLPWLVSSYRTCHSSSWVTWSLPLTACTHQVEVGEDAGGPVLLGHE